MSAAFLKHPVILIHGFSDMPSLSGSWKVVEELLTQMGVQHFTPDIPPFGSIKERSKSLVSQIVSKYPQETVHLFGHSMGGLNARDIASMAMKSDIGFKVSTVSTFGAPHRGLRMIDSVPDAGGSSEVTAEIREIWGTDFGAIENLKYSFVVKYNQEIANDPTVKYFSWAGEINVPTPLFSATFPLSRLFGPTDGLVNVDSATWGPDLGPGVHLGTIGGLDHAAIIGLTAATATIPHLKAAEIGATSIVVQMDRNILRRVGNFISGTFNVFLAPIRALFGTLGLRF